MTRVFLSLGSNLGDRRYYIEAMVEGLLGILTPAVAKSRLMETDPVDTELAQPRFLNVIMTGGYHSSAHELLDECQTIENRLGRVRTGRKKSPRTADIDILMFGADIISDERLTVPHPHLLKRRFCIEGLYEIAPGSCIPGLGLTVTKAFEAMDTGIGEQDIVFLDK
jgi:2-amino-4-hydroxy-6-hydroxymethyldihydropteridine diphosphokinase